MQLSVKADVKAAQAFYRELGQRGVRKAAMRAINDTLVTIRAEGARLIKQEHPALKIGDIKREMRHHRANSSNLRGEIDVTGKPLSLKLFGATKVKRGVTARVGKARKGLVTYRGRKAFIIDAYDGEVFVRKFDKGRQIRRFRGPSMPGVFRAQYARFKKIAAEKWPKAFKSRIEYEIQRAQRMTQARSAGEFRYYSLGGQGVDSSRLLFGPMRLRG